MITDAQLHLWPPETAQAPWPPHARSYAHGPSFSAASALAEMDRAGVDRAVLVPPSWSGDSNDFCLAAAAACPSRFAVVGRMPLTPPRDSGWLREWLARPGLYGVRLTFARGEAARWLDEGRAEWLWTAAARAEVPVFVYAPHKLDRLARIARKHPDLRLTVDHLGLGVDQRDEEMDAVLRGLIALAGMPNVAVKATSLPSHTRETYPFTGVRRRLEPVVAAFGPRRVFWGSDLSRLPCPYRDCVRLFTEASFLDGDELDWIMDRGVREWIGWR